MKIDTARWWVLGLISFASLASFYVYDSIAPLAHLLHQQLRFSYAQIGTLNAIYSLPNIGMALIGGLLADRYGAPVVALWTSAICLAGALLTAAGSHFWVMAAGRLLFGIGGDTLFVAMLVALGRWFIGQRAALALALFFSISRIGSYLADISPEIAKPLYDLGWRPPLLLAAVAAGLSLAATIGYAGIEARVRLPAVAPGTARLAWHTLRQVNSSFWFLLGMATLFYSVIFPFRSTFSIDYFENAKGLSLQAAGITNSWVFFAAIFASPVFGWMVDRFGHAIGMMTLGMLALVISFLILGLTGWPLWVTTALIGLSFSLVPAVVWPEVTRLVEVRRLGAAFGLMTILQNIGMALCNVTAGWLNDRTHAGPGHPEGYQAMIWFFAALSLAGFAFIAWLWVRELKRPMRVERGAT